MAKKKSPAKGRKPPARKQTATAPNLARIARQHIEAYNRGDWDRLKAALTSTCVYKEFGTQRQLEGPDQIAQAYQAWKQALPDSTGTVKAALSHGNTVVLEVLWEGTQTGTFNGPTGSVPPTGKRFSVPAAQLVTVAGSKINRIRHYFDLLTFLQQIGAAPSS